MQLFWAPRLNQKLVEIFVFETCIVLVLLALIKRTSFDRVVGRVHLLVGITYVKFWDVSSKLVWLKSLSLKN